MLGFQAEAELNLSLYRHWSVTNSLRHTPYTAAKFKTFSIKGETKVSEFLADAGLPLQQCQQSFQAMDLVLRNDVVPSFVSKAAKYGLDELTYSSFTASFGFRHRYSAVDMVHCLQAVVEHRGEGVDSTKPFLEALDTLARSNTESLEQGFKMARTQLEYMVWTHSLNDYIPCVTMAPGEDDPEHPGHESCDKCGTFPLCCPTRRDHQCTGLVNIRVKFKPRLRIIPLPVPLSTEHSHLLCALPPCSLCLLFSLQVSKILKLPTGSWDLN